MDVLQYALVRVAGGDAEEVGVGLVPGLGQLGDAQLAREQCELQLKSDDDVEVVGGLIGLHADEGALDAVGVAEPILRAQRVPGEVSVDAWNEPLKEGKRSPDHVLPEATLTLVEAHTGGGGQSCTRVPGSPCSYIP